MKSEITGEAYDGPASKFDDSRFINSSTLMGMDEVKMTIEEVISLSGSFKFENGRTLGEDTLCIRFKGSPKVLKLNKTNLRTCQKILGNMTAEWVGKKIKIYTDPTVMFGGKQVGGVKVKDEPCPTD